MNDAPTSGHPRRGFLARLLAATGAIAAAGLAPGALRGETATSPETPRTGNDHDRWLDALKGEHRQIFDVPAHGNGRPLNQVRNFLNAYRDDYGVPDEKVNVVVGIHGGAVPMVFRDEAWAKFGLGERNGIVDPRTRAPATRNIFLRGEQGDAVDTGASILALQKRGAVFLLCNNSLKRVTGTLAAAGFGTPEAVRAELLDLLLPGVTVVPAMVVAMNRAQARSFTYVYAG
jgi:intracellular sulfur oxidation DsrE/DsrF family protein